jgi:hypothetical protein
MEIKITDDAVVVCDFDFGYRRSRGRIHNLVGDNYFFVALSRNTHHPAGAAMQLAREKLDGFWLSGRTHKGQ